MEISKHNSFRVAKVAHFADCDNTLVIINTAMNVTRELTTSRLGLGLFRVVGRDVSCGVRAVWLSIVVVVPYRPICLSP